MDDERNDESAGGDGQTSEPEAAEPEPAASEDAQPEAPPSPDERIEQVGERIDKARAKAQDNFRELGQPFVESGNEESEREDDQTIAPPG